ncbi:MAG: YkgJ family cysteine cluster protein [Rhodospirillaceae bacterium]|nr:YkgJ family cysteine cluster protein [Rhodospirillaceae bacterium]
MTTPGDADRAQLLQDDVLWVGRPFDVLNNPRAIQANARHLALMLRNAADPARATRAASFMGHLLDATMAAHGSAQVACSKGCHYCCKTYVSATIPEILLLARAVRGKTATEARVAEAAAKSVRIPQDQREANRFVCPILHDKVCSEYAQRPLVCRAVLSKSLDTCLRIFELSQNEPMALTDNSVNVRSCMVIIWRSALILAGVPHQHHEMNHALAIALATPDAERRWLAGEPIFAAVAMDKGEDGPSKLSGLVDHLVQFLRPTL